MTAPTRPGPQLADLLRRLWAWNVSSWRHGNRIDVTRTALAELAVLATQHDGLERPPVPDVGAHALVDQLMVLLQDAWDAGVPDDRIDVVTTRLAADLKLG